MLFLPLNFSRAFVPKRIAGGAIGRNPTAFSDGHIMLNQLDSQAVCPIDSTHLTTDGLLSGFVVSVKESTASELIAIGLHL